MDKDVKVGKVIRIPPELVKSVELMVAALRRAKKERLP